MLGKLFKHEMKATARLLLPLYAILAVLTVMDRIVIYLDIFKKGVLAIIPGFVTFAYVVSLIAIIVVSSVIIIIRFYKNLMTDEGYLMFTLPVKSHELINSKMFASYIWSVTSFVAVMASLLVVFSGAQFFPDIWENIKSAYAQARDEIGAGTLNLLIIEFIVMIIISIYNSIMMIYVSIAIGQLFNGHKVLGSFAAYIAITTVIQVLMTVITVVFSYVFRNSIEDIDTIPTLIFPISIISLVVLSAAYYIATNWIFKRKLNLE